MTSWAAYCWAVRSPERAAEHCPQWRLKQISQVRHWGPSAHAQPRRICSAGYTTGLLLAGPLEGPSPSFRTACAHANKLLCAVGASGALGWSTFVCCLGCLLKLLPGLWGAHREGQALSCQLL